jgi:L-ribulose-5-phosphate 4-epimerase
MLENLKNRVWRCNLSLKEEGLVAGTSGNVSARDPETGHIVIKPSGVPYLEMQSEDMVLVDKQGRRVEGRLNPSVDLENHLYIYMHDPQIHGVVHTHSNYATAFAAAGRPIPCVLTEIADEFGEAIPCAPYATNEGEAIGEAIMRARCKGPAVLLANHGVFTFAGTPEAALKAAVMVEHAAKTVLLAMQIGDPKEISPEEAIKWWARYHERYGQK